MQSETRERLSAIESMTVELIRQKHQLQDQVETLQAQLEQLSTKLAALEAENNTLNQEALDVQQRNASAEKDTEWLTQLREELSSHVNEIDRRIEEITTDGQ